MRYPIITLACTTVLLSTLAFAQQPDTPPAPAPPPAAPGQPSRPKMVRDVRIIRSDRPDDIRAGFRMGPPGMWWKNSDLIQKLTLTADQQKRMDDIFQQSRLQLIDLKANLERQEVTLEPMLDANPPDTNKILAQIDKTAQARAELEKGNARMLLGIRNVLTPDQWTKLQASERENRHIIIRKGPGEPGTGGPSNFHYRGGESKGPEGMLLPPPPGTPENLDSEADALAELATF